MSTGLRSAFAGRSAWQEGDPVGFFRTKRIAMCRNLLYPWWHRKQIGGREDERTVP